MKSMNEVLAASADDPNFEKQLKAAARAALAAGQPHAQSEALAGGFAETPWELAALKGAGAAAVAITTLSTVTQLSNTTTILQSTTILG
jgi:hypothetical protein